jgi:hypothetical protein
MMAVCEKMAAEAPVRSMMVHHRLEGSVADSGRTVEEVDLRTAAVIPGDS